jgi:multicomponent Na+:H+ antiporter subunit D
MLLAMGITAFLCIAVGVFPAPLYELLPYEVNYENYTTTHVITQLQLLMGSALAFTVLTVYKIYPPELKSVNLDFDWTYRRFLPSVLRYAAFLVSATFAMLTGAINAFVANMVHRLHHSHGPDGSRAASWPSGAMVLSIAALLGLALFVIFFS